MALAELPEVMDLEPIIRLGRDLRAAAGRLTEHEARYLVDLYYQTQEFRKAAANEQRAAATDGEPNALITWTYATMATVERQIKAGLDGYTDHHPVGRWSKSIVGIGPVLAAGLLAHIDITRAPTVGHIWRFAGLDPTVQWGKGERRPWNARLKVLCWKIGESFVKVSGNDRDVYGQVYLARKAVEQARNLAGAYADQARATLESKRFGKDTDAYKWYLQGQLPPARIHLRAQRYAVKLFLAHWHHVAYEVRYGTPPPRPYVLDHILGHVHYLAPPNWP